MCICIYGIWCKIYRRILHTNVIILQSKRLKTTHLFLLMAQVCSYDAFQLSLRFSSPLTTTLYYQQLELHIALHYLISPP